MTFSRHTPFYAQQAAVGAEFVDRYGFAAAANYGSTEGEHKAVREAVGVFDVYAQTMIDVQGMDALELLQELTVNDLSKAAPGSGLYTSMCNESGGMVDDMTVFRLGPSHFWLCPTPSRLDVVERWLKTHRGARHVGIVALGYRNAYLSIQGPNARTLLSRLTSADISKDSLKYFRFIWDIVAGVPQTMISRTGYSGELGFELFFPSEYSAHMWRAIFEAGKDLGVTPCGLGALVSLRMEKKYPLYGADLTEDISPLEAGLGWTVKLDKGAFIGKAALDRQRASGVGRKFVQLAFPRLGVSVVAGDKILSEGKVVGHLTSVAEGFSVGKTLALGYVATAEATDGKDVAVQGREGEIQARIGLYPAYDRDRQRLLS